MSGKITVTEGIKETTSYGAPAYVLTIAVSNPEGYGESILQKRPEACFIYKRTIPSEPLKNTFNRVASMDDFFTIPEATSGDGGDSEGLYRQASFVARYKEYNSALADKESILAQLRVFYNNLNTYVDSYTTVETERSYIFPDYDQDLLDKYIATYRGLDLTNNRDSASIEILQKTIIPLLTSNQIIYASIKSTADSLLATARNRVTDITNFTSMQSNLLALSSKMDVYNNSNVKVVTRYITLTGYFNDISDYAESITDATIKNAIKAVVENGLVITSDTGFVESGMSKAEIGNFIADINPSVSKIKDLDMTELTDLSVIEQLVETIESFGDTIDLKIEEKNQEIALLKENIIRRKSEMQVLEAKMKAIRPTIDITNPESAWYLTLTLKK